MSVLFENCTDVNCTTTLANVTYENETYEIYFDCDAGYLSSNNTRSSGFFHATVYAMYCPVLIIAVLGNGAVCFIVSSTPRMQTVTNFFITNLAVGDLLMAVFCVPFTFMPIFLLHYWPFGTVLCPVVNYSQAVSVFVSAYTLVAISIDRYMAIMWPLKPRLTKRYAATIIFVVWLFALVTALPIAIVSRLTQPSPWHQECDRYVCTEEWPSQKQNDDYSMALMILQFVIPLIVLIFTYTSIAVVVWCKRIPGEAENSRDQRFARSKRKVTEEERLSIADRTVGQFDNPEYTVYKTNRLTASLFGNVVRRQDHTPCDALVKQILKDPNATGRETEAIKYGKRHESTAIKMFESLKEKEAVKVSNCGLFIDSANSFLGASPDGITNTDALIEVKCLYSLATKRMNVHEACNDAVMKNKICLKMDSNGIIQLKRTHNYYYQMIKMMLAVVIVFTLCWLPFNTLVVATYSNIMPEIPGLPYMWLGLHWLAMSHSCYNPIIYCYMNARFRAGFLQMVASIPCCERCVPLAARAQRNSLGFGMAGSDSTENTLLHRVNTCSTYITMRHKTLSTYQHPVRSASVMRYSNRSSQRANHNSDAIHEDQI